MSSDAFVIGVLKLLKLPKYKAKYKVSKTFYANIFVGKITPMVKRA